jgi:hypothetical protein
LPESYSVDLFNKIAVIYQLDGDNQSSIFNDNFKNEKSNNILNSTEFTQTKK